MDNRRRYGTLGPSSTFVEPASLSVTERATCSSTSSQRVPCRLAGSRGPQNRSRSKRSQSESDSQHAYHCRGRCRLNALTSIRTTSQSNSGASRSSANNAISAGPDSTQGSSPAPLQGLTSSEASSTLRSSQRRTSIET